MLDNIVLQGIEERKIKVSVPVTELEKGLWKVLGLEQVYKINMTYIPEYRNYFYKEVDGNLYLYKDVSYHGSMNFEKCGYGHITDPELIEIYHILLSLHDKILMISEKKEEN